MISQTKAIEQLPEFSSATAQFSDIDPPAWAPFDKDGTQGSRIARYG
jgi:hypothetical protein